jgi:hypothetical protein
MNTEISPEKQMLEKLLAERDELNRHISFLQRRLGFTGDCEPDVAPGSADLPYNSIQIGEFYSLSRPQAAAALLKKVRKPLTTSQILEMLTAAGLSISGKNALNGLYTALTRNRDIRKVAPNTWGLREWYPNAKEDKRRNTGSDRPAFTDEETEPEE